MKIETTNSDEDDDESEVDNTDELVNDDNYHGTIKQIWAEIDEQLEQLLKQQQVSSS